MKGGSVRLTYRSGGKRRWRSELQAKDSIDSVNIKIGAFRRLRSTQELGKLLFQCRFAPLRRLGQAAPAADVRLYLQRHHFDELSQAAWHVSPHSTGIHSPTANTDGAGESSVLLAARVPRGRRKAPILTFTPSMESLACYSQRKRCFPPALYVRRTSSPFIHPGSHF